MSENTELKPCPFCGEQHIWTYKVSYAPENMRYVMCAKDPEEHDGCVSGVSVSAWNTRPLEDNLRAELEAVKADRDSEQRGANEYHQQAERLEAELEAEKFAHWQSDQALITAQQEISEMHALNLYDLVGDADQLRADMVATIKERDELRKRVDRQLGVIGNEIAQHAWTRARLAQIEEQHRSYERVHVEAVTEYDQIIKRLQAELQQAREALNNLRLATANFMRLEDNEDEDKSWAALENLSRALDKASAALPEPPKEPAP